MMILILKLNNEVIFFHSSFQFKQQQQKTMMMLKKKTITIIIKKLRFTLSSCRQYIYIFIGSTLIYNKIVRLLSTVQHTQTKLHTSKLNMVYIGRPKRNETRRENFIMTFRFDHNNNIISTLKTTKLFD